MTIATQILSQDTAEKNFLKEFSDYDQTVDVVSCWQSLSRHLMSNTNFYRFGKFRTKQGGELTPDFAVAEAVSHNKLFFAAPGALVCDIKKFPNPFPETDDSKELERAYNIFGKSVEDIFKYAVPLSYVSEHGKLPKVTFTDHDVVLLTPSEIADPVYTHLVSKIQKKPFNIGRPLILVEYFYSQGDQLERYVFRWKQGEANSPFSNPILRDRMVTRSQTIKVFPKHFLEYKIRHVLCNDEPPIIYLLVFLWVEVFLKFLSPDELENWQTTTTRTIEIAISLQQLHTKLQEEYSSPFSIHDLRRALQALCDLKRAELKDRTRELYVISFYNIAARTFQEMPGEQEGVAERGKFRDYGRVFARLLARKELAPPPPPPRRRFRGKAPKDHPILPFGD